QTHLVDTDTESRPIKDLREIEVPQPLLIVPSPVPSSDDLHLTVGQAHTPATVDTESEPEEAPSETEEFKASEPSDTMITTSHSSASSDYTAPLSPDHPLTQTLPTSTPTQVSFHRRTTRMVVRTQPTLSLGMLARIAEATALSPSSFHTEDESLDLGTEREGSEDEGPGSEDEGPGSKDEGPVMDEPLGLGYRALRRRELVVGEGDMPNPKDGRVYTDIPTYVPPAAPVQTPPSPEWSSGSLPVSPSSIVVPSPIASLVTTPATTISVDEDQFLKRAALWHSIYDIQRENHDLRMQIAKERHERLELIDRVARIERRHESRGE
ncbi:hypothetical protein Tco_1426167, partial [Tanacetum coccineum]